jgi:hypothetical protein
MAISPAGLATKNDSSGEDQQRFTRPINRLREPWGPVPLGAYEDSGVKKL